MGFRIQRDPELLRRCGEILRAFCILSYDELVADSSSDIRKEMRDKMVVTANLVRGVDGKLRRVNMRLKRPARKDGKPRTEENSWYEKWEKNPQGKASIAAEVWQEQGESFPAYLEREAIGRHEGRPGIEALDWANQVLKKYLNVSETYQSYFVKLRVAPVIGITIAVDANNPEEAKSKAVQRALQDIEGELGDAMSIESLGIPEPVSVQTETEQTTAL